MLVLAGDTLENFQINRMLKREIGKRVGDRETSLRIEDLELGESVASDLLRFFQDCSSKDGLVMESLVIHHCTFNLCLISVVHTAMSLDLFKELSLGSHEEEHLSLGLLRALRPIETPIERLRTLDIDFNILTPSYISFLRDIVSRAENIECLSLSGCSGLSKSTFEKMFSSCYNLQTFRLECNAFSLEDSVVSRLIERVVEEQNPFLQELDLRNTYCGDETLREIVDCLQQEGTLSTVIIADPPGINDDNDEAMGRNFSNFASAVKDSNSLQELTISCKLPSEEIEGLLDVLMRCPTLEKLHLSSSNASSLNFESIDVEALARDVRICSSLRELAVYDNQLSAAEPLFRIASHCPKLEVLELRATGLERLDFGTSFAQPSPCCGCLRVLNLDSNPFDKQVTTGLGEEHENMITAVLQANPLLYLVKFSNAGKHRDRIRNLMDMNWAGRVLLGNNKMPQSLWGLVIERVNENQKWTILRKANAIYGLLRFSDMAHLPLNRSMKRKFQLHQETIEYG
jgi:Ran GTPase-activating protein (RanGAP) involved in mRNA processing and transport